MTKILLVDDDLDVIEATTMVLEREGFEVISANNRGDGMAMAKSANPDLFILDVMMESPDDGFLLAQDLRKQGFTKPILMLSSVSRVLGMSFGKDNELVPVDAFVEKPVKPSVLVKQVQQLLAAPEQKA